MSSTRTRIIAVALAAVATVIALVVIVSVLRHPPIEPRSDSGLPVEAVTPEEISLDVTVRSDGTLAVSQLLVFDTPVGSERPVRWAIGGIGIGWIDRDRDAQYAVLPRVSQVSAQDVSSPSAEAVDLTVVRDAHVEDLFHDDVVFTIAPPDRGRWSSGRHAVTVDYVLADVFVAVEGRNLFVMPLRFPHGPEDARSYRSLTVPAGAAVECLPSNVTFAPDASCQGLREPDVESDPSVLRWTDDPFTRIDAVAFAAPGDVTAAPLVVDRHPS
ncbi:hypothetical protein [Brevibacterium sp.]|uniref:hypothetical protein n=1 Tax=Brevibacterium sp. TaxID=1701 RepID=UPI002810A030|nr:hypothetical protein [Brevibacterium sp.]